MFETIRYSRNMKKIKFSGTSTELIEFIRRIEKHNEKKGSVLQYVAIKIKHEEYLMFVANFSDESSKSIRIYKLKPGIDLEDDIYPVLKTDFQQCP